MTRDGTWVSSPDQLSTAAGVGEALDYRSDKDLLFFFFATNQMLPMEAQMKSFFFFSPSDVPATSIFDFFETPYPVDKASWLSSSSPATMFFHYCFWRDWFLF